MKAVTFTILGEAVAKGNEKRIFVVGGHARMADKPAAKEFKRACARCIPFLQEPWTCDVKVTCVMYYGSRRKDLDASLVYDGMQGKIIVNDRQVKEQHNYWRLDRVNPRIEVTVEPWMGELFDEDAA